MLIDLFYPPRRPTRARLALAVVCIVAGFGIIMATELFCEFAAQPVKAYTERVGTPWSW
jgi:hypothetical protein